MMHANIKYRYIWALSVHMLLRHLMLYCPCTAHFVLHIDLYREACERFWCNRVKQ